MDRVGPNVALVNVVKQIIAKGKQRGYVTYEEFNKLMPAGEFTSEQIEDTMTMLEDIGIKIVIEAI